MRGKPCERGGPLAPHACGRLHYIVVFFDFEHSEVIFADSLIRVFAWFMEC